MVCVPQVQRARHRKCFRLRDLIEELIKSGNLRKFLEDAADGKVVVPKVRRDPQGNQEENPEG